MTRELAIEILSTRDFCGMLCGYTSGYTEALDMAVEAIQAKDEQGEWIDKGDYALCSKCGGSSGTQFDGVERIPRITTYCPHCGVRMKVGDDE